MSAPNGEFQKRALALFQAGHRVVPIPKGRKGPTVDGWTGFADGQTAEQVQELARSCNGSGVGVLAKWTAGVDIDVRDYELAQKLAGLAHTLLGSTVERIGQAPKLLLPYRVERPFTKLSSHSFRLPGDQPGDKPHKVEILADGQQWVAYHTHPDTGRPYHWPEGDLPAREDLPEITADRARLFIERAEALIVAAGGRIEAGKLERGSSRSAKASAHGQAGTYEAVVDALRHIPNRDLDYDDWVEIGLAIKGALGEPGRELWDGWSEQSTKNDPTVTGKFWDGFKPHAIGAGTIYHHARRAGWKPDKGLALNPEKAEKKREKKQQTRNKADGGSAVESLPHVEPDAKPTIRLTAGELHQHVAESAQALAALGNVYRRGSALVRVGRLATDLDRRGVRQAAGSLAILTYEADGLLVPLSEAARFERFDGRSETWRTCDPHSGLARAILASPDRWSSIPVLLGIVEAPTLRADGTVLDKPGYDPASGIYLDTTDTAFAPIPSHPSRSEAVAALDKLLEILAGFPFVDDAARAVAVSAILSALVRRSLRAAPMVVLTAPKMGSGKTLLAAICGYIATGRPAAVMTQDTDPVSERKRLLALLMSGAAVAVIDNIERPLKSAAMCSILTEPEYQDRVLGASQQVSVPTNIFWLATGNNVTVGGDLSTRVLVAGIDPACERPEERSFAVDLHQEVPRRRGELAAAALTVIRAYLAVGEPDLGLPPFGRFEQWQRWCRFPLVWLGLSDPCATRRSVETRDPEREKLMPLLAAWRDAFGKEPVTCRAAIDRANAAVAANGLMSDEPGKALHVAIEDAALNRGALDSRRLGNFISQYERRFEGGLRFERAGETRLGTRWRAVPESAGFAGFAGLSHTANAKCQADTSDSLRGQWETDPQNPHNPQTGSAPNGSGEWRDFGPPEGWTDDAPNLQPPEFDL